MLGLIGSTLTFATDPPKAPTKQGLANPASVNCTQLGGMLDMRTRTEGGLKITGYESDAEIDCAITGGEVDRQAGSCQSAEGTRCGLDENLAGSCPAG
ncbi:MAG: DUF333 domain-containing protein [Lamprobacter sp.]|uniref:DUF333 domain-containing protein n=1 Tax=Lamprobacter sp. TaxID=3100796 RepID=UPI002B25E294|nr:DUF333 domain-containing protein [Lamprobacter sp.]MEA3638817.1 DUF333 domain-containing protein [Lamprobacter sp.]